MLILAACKVLAQHHQLGRGDKVGRRASDALYSQVDVSDSVMPVSSDNIYCALTLSLPTVKHT